MSEASFSRAPENRPASLKAFRVETAALGGASNGEMLKKHTRFAQATQMHETCMKYATSYALMMMHRVAEE